MKSLLEAINNKLFENDTLNLLSDISDSDNVEQVQSKTVNTKISANKTELTIRSLYIPDTQQIIVLACRADYDKNKIIDYLVDHGYITEFQTNTVNNYSRINIQLIQKFTLNVPAKYRSSIIVLVDGRSYESLSETYILGYSDIQ